MGLRQMDHLVVAVPDLVIAAQKFQHLGFSVDAVRSHPWGTQNRLIWLNGLYIELIQLGPEFHEEKLSGSVTCFTTPVQRGIKAGTGPILLALSSCDAGADAQDFIDAGIGQGDILSFERDHSGPMGRVQIGFALAFTQLHGRSGPLFTCQRLQPELLERAPEVHNNTVFCLQNVTMTADNPADFAHYCSHATGQFDFRASSMGLSFKLGEGALQVLSPEAFPFQSGLEPVTQVEQLGFAAIGLQARDREVFFKIAEKAGFMPFWHDQKCIIPGQNLYGLAIFVGE